MTIFHPSAIAALGGWSQLRLDNSVTDSLPDEFAERVERVSFDQRLQRPSDDLEIARQQRGNRQFEPRLRKGRLALTVVPWSVESISNRPPRCLKRSRMPEIPLPEFACLRLVVSAPVARIPVPASITSSLAPASSRMIRTLAVGLAE